VKDWAAVEAPFCALSRRSLGDSKSTVLDIAVTRIRIVIPVPPAAVHRITIPTSQVIVIPVEPKARLSESGTVTITETAYPKATPKSLPTRKQRRLPESGTNSELRTESESEPSILFPRRRAQYVVLTDLLLRRPHPIIPSVDPPPICYLEVCCLQGCSRCTRAALLAEVCWRMFEHIPRSYYSSDE
jgi:hypothetical protein